MACTRRVEFDKVNERGDGKTHDTDTEPLTVESLAEVDQSVLKERKIDKADARTGASMRVI